jgi:serine/threonine-protein kinase
VAQKATPARIWPWAAALAIALCLGAVGWWRTTRSASLAPLVQLSVELSADATPERQAGFPALSPDGARLALTVRGADGQFRLATRRLDQSELVPLAGTEGAAYPLFSPDGEWIAFNAGRKLRKIAVQGGASQVLCDISTARFGGSWGDDDSIIAPLGVGAGLSRIPAAGGAPTPVTTLNREKGELAHRWPQILPENQAILFTVYYNNRNYDDADIEVLSLKTGQRKTVFHGGFFGRYVPSGHLVYIHQNTLFAAPFDLRRLVLSGTPQPMVESISNSMDSVDLAFSRNGTAVYLSGKERLQRSIFWLDSSGKIEPLHPESGLYGFPRFSPDGKRLAFSMDNSQGGRDIWVKDLERAATSRLTLLPGQNGFPVWTRDGHVVVFLSSNPAAPGIYWIRADGVGEAQRLTDGRTRVIALSFSPDGKRLAGIQPVGSGGVDIWIAPVEGDRDHPRLGKPEMFVQSSAIKLFPGFSLDGRWLAYQSNESGRNEVYVRPFPGPGGLRQISTGGGTQPIWSHNGRELFFVALDGRIMVIDYMTNADAFVFGKVRVWAEKRLLNPGFVLYTTDLAPDGKRFAVVLYPDGTAEQKPATHVTFLLNFFDELRRRVPAGTK